MPDHRPTKTFNLNANPKNASIRDKDNVATRFEPKHLPTNPAPNLAPTGSLGIKRNLPIGTQPAKRFTIKKAGDLSKEFKSIAPRSPAKGHDWER